MASSWAEYDASHRRGSGGGAHNGTSLLSSTSDTKKRRSSSASSAAAPASSSGGAKRKSAKRAPTGIDALYVDAPPGIDTRLQFQWMRPHPSSAILAAAAAAESKSGGAGGANISPHIVEAARLVEHYRQAKADSCPNGDSRSKPNKSQKRKLPLPKVDMGCVNAEVELTSLFDPPLLSEWGIPGASMNITYDDKNDDQGAFSDSDSDESYVHRAGGTHITNSDDDGKSKEISAAEVESALGKLVQCAAATKGTTQLNDSTKQIFCDLSAATANYNLLELLPSRMLLRKVQDVASYATDGGSYHPVGVKSLTMLADITQSESMGRHILSVLAPVLLCSSSDTVMEMEGEIITSLKLLAKTLIRKCGLGKLLKGNLHQLAEGGEIGTSTTTEPSELLDQFLIAIGRAYHE